MADRQQDNGRAGGGEELREAVHKKEKNRARGRREKRHSILFGLGMFGLVGWSVALPTVAGIAAGVWVDMRWPGDMSWTLNLLIIGVVIGCLNAWYWVKRTGGG